VFLLIVVGLLGGTLAALYAPIYREAVDNVQDIDNKLVLTPTNPSVIVSADGHTLYSVAQLHRTIVPVETLPSYVRYAMVAAEDRRFYDHRGVDLIGLTRSAFLALRDRRASQGGSTIEMQLAKKLVNGDERSMTRKLKDIATAQQIENLKTKSQILNLYMNEVYFGEGAWGIQAAAQTYFNKDAKDLTVGEAAMLARCVKSPSRENPVRDLKGSIARRDYVLDVMYQEHWITDDQYQSAYKEVPKLNPNPPEGASQIDPIAGYFVDHVVTTFHQDFPGVDLQSGGYRIVTTLNYRLQRAAVQAVRDTIRRHRDDKVNDGAFVLIDSQGRIVAEVGGPSYAKSKFNTVVQGRLQPGSAFKPFLYATAIRDGLVHPGDMISNEPVHEVSDTGVRWDPSNNRGEPVGGAVRLERAFALSYNLPAIHTIMAETPEAVIKSARDVFGLRGRLPPYDSLAIGTGLVSPLEMAEGYSVFMLHGDRVRPYPISKVVGPEGTTLKEYQPTSFPGVLDPTVCQDLDDLMLDVVQWGTGTAARDVPDARGKTGTTQQAKAAWFCGYSDGLLGVGWVGHSGKNHEQLAMGHHVYGGTVTAGMWAQVMMAAHAMGLAVAPPPMPKPTTVAQRQPTPERIDPLNKAPDADGQPDAQPNPYAAPPAGTQSGPGPGDQTQPAPRTTPPPTVPASKPGPSASKQDDDSNYVTVEVCADTGLLANQYCPETVEKRFKKGTEPKQVCRLHTGD
jgi:penicillin-binding protein 1A